MQASHLVQSALYLAARAHHNQCIPGSNLPYLVHLCDVGLEVAATLAVEPGHNHELALCCALLHDVLEDTDMDEATLSALFGPAITAGVRALTKNPTLPIDQRIPDSLRRIQLQPREIWLVKLADRISNLSHPPPPHWTPERIRAYRAESELILATLGSSSPRLSGRLRELIDRYTVPNEG